MPSSRGSSQPRDRTCVLTMSPALTGGLFTTNTTWEAPWDMDRYALSPLAFMGRGLTSSCPWVPPRPLLIFFKLIPFYPVPCSHFPHT